VIQNPVERGRADDAIEAVVKWECSQIGSDEGDAGTEIGEVLAGVLYHVAGKVKADDSATRHAFGENSGKSSTATAGVENEFIAAQVELAENFLPPMKLRFGVAVIGHSIPLF